MKAFMGNFDLIKAEVIAIRLTYTFPSSGTKVQVCSGVVHYERKRP